MKIKFWCIIFKYRIFLCLVRKNKNKSYIYMIYLKNKSYMYYTRGSVSAKFKRNNWRAASACLYEPFGATFQPIITQKLFNINKPNLVCKLIPILVSIYKLSLISHFINTDNTAILRYKNRDFYHWFRDITCKWPWNLKFSIRIKSYEYIMKKKRKYCFYDLKYFQIIKTIFYCRFTYIFIDFIM